MIWLQKKLPDLLKTPFPPLFPSFLVLSTSIAIHSHFFDNTEEMGLVVSQTEGALNRLQLSRLTALPTTVFSTAAPGFFPAAGPSPDTIEFDAVLDIQGTPYPVQKWTAIFADAGAVFENRPEDHWPKARIQFCSNTSLGAERVRNFFSVLPELAVSDLTIRPADDTAEAEVLYTRVFLALVITGSSTLRDLHGREVFSLRHDGLSEDDHQRLVDRAKLFRKLRFIETVFNTTFELPPSEITADEVRLTEIIFNGVSQGISIDRGSDITLRNVSIAGLDVAKAPFSGPGEFRRVVSWEGRYVGLFGKTLDVGTVTLILRNAEIADPRIIDKMVKDPNRTFDLRFVVYDHQILHRFERYLGGPLTQRLQRLNRFKKRLRTVEPPPIAELISEPLARDVSQDQAIQIATGWLYINRFPDRYCPQAPELVAIDRCWRVPIRLVYADGRNGLVGELRVDLQSGKIVSHTAINEIRRNGMGVAEALIHA